MGKVVDYIDQLKTDGKSLRTRETYAFWLNDFFHSIRKPVDKVEIADVRKYLKTKDKEIVRKVKGGNWEKQGTPQYPREGLGDSSKALFYTALKNFYRFQKNFNFAEELLEERKRLQMHEKEAQVLTLQQEKDLLREAKNESECDFLLLWLLDITGMRISEACSIKHEDLNLDLLQKKLVRVMGKRKKVRPVLFLKKWLEAYKGFHDKRTDGLPYLFPHYNPKTKAWQNMTPTKAWENGKRIANLAGIPYFKLHMLRATYITRSHEENRDLLTTAKAVGQDSLETTKGYIKFDNKKLLQTPHFADKMCKDIDNL